VRVIRIPRLALLGVAMLAFGAAFPAFGWPAVLGWLMLAPLAALWWVLRVRTTASEQGITARGVFSSRTLAWEDINGVRFPKRGFARATLTDGSEAKLPAVSYDRLADLADASHGHIPNPFTAAKPGQPDTQ
jgi:hypothetical protein